MLSPHSQPVLLMNHYVHVTTCFPPTVNQYYWWIVTYTWPCPFAPQSASIIDESLRTRDHVLSPHSQPVLLMNRYVHVTTCFRPTVNQYYWWIITYTWPRAFPPQSTSIIDESLRTRDHALSPHSQPVLLMNRYVHVTTCFRPIVNQYYWWIVTYTWPRAFAPQSTSITDESLRTRDHVLSPHSQPVLLMNRYVHVTMPFRPTVSQYYWWIVTYTWPRAFAP